MSKAATEAAQQAANEAADALIAEEEAEKAQKCGVAKKAKKSKKCKARKTVGVRVPSHPVTAALLRRLDTPLLCGSVPNLDDTYDDDVQDRIELYMNLQRQRAAIRIQDSWRMKALGASGLRPSLTLLPLLPLLLLAARLPLLLLVVWGPWSLLRGLADRGSQMIAIRRPGGRACGCLVSS